MADDTLSTPTDVIVIVSPKKAGFGETDMLERVGAAKAGGTIKNGMSRIKAVKKNLLFILNY